MFLDTGRIQIESFSYLRILKLKLGPVPTPVEVWTHIDQYWRSYGTPVIWLVCRSRNSVIGHGDGELGGHVLCHNFVNTDRYGSILRWELGMDPTSISRYEDTSKDSIWIRPYPKTKILLEPRQP